MARNGSGTYSLPSTSVTPAVGSTLISSSAFNTFTSDLASALTQSVSKDGQTVMTGNLDLDGNAVIFYGDGDSKIDASTDDQIDVTLNSTIYYSFKTTAFTIDVPLEAVESANEIIKQQVFS